MKKTVFLLCLVFLFLPKTTAQGAFNNETYSFDNFNIILANHIIDGARGITVEKTGTDPFYTTILDLTESYIINGVVHENNQFIIFGSVHKEGSPTYYDSLFIVLDDQGVLVDKKIIDFDELEEIKGVYFIDGIFITHTYKAKDINEEYVFDNNFFTSYDSTYNYIDQIEIGSYIKEIYGDSSYIYFNFDYDGILDGAIRDDLSILLPSEFIDISNNEVFIESLKIEFLNEALLNNELVENGLSLDYPGNYKLIHNNAEYNFVLKPLITGLVDNQTYTSSVTPYISAGNTLLNNDVYVSGSEIYKPGNYELSIYGIGNYIETYNFTITSNLTGIVNDHTYSEPVEVSFNGDAYLNNQYVTSPLEVNEVGDYILKIKGENNYLETYYFQIETETDNLSIVDFVQRFDIYILVVVIISGGIILKKK